VHLFSRDLDRIQLIVPLEKSSRKHLQPFPSLLHYSYPFTSASWNHLPEFKSVSGSALGENKLKPKSRHDNPRYVFTRCQIHLQKRTLVHQSFDVGNFIGSI
jgi:hypothetical protein